MKTRGKLTFAIAAVALGASFVNAAQKNPFAEWDEISKKSAETTGAESGSDSELPEKPRTTSKTTAKKSTAPQPPGNASQPRSRSGSDSLDLTPRQRAAVRSGQADLTTPQEAVSRKSGAPSNQISAKKTPSSTGAPPVRTANLQRELENAVSPDAFAGVADQVESADYSTDAAPDGQVVPVSEVRSSESDSQSSNPFADLLNASETADSSKSEDFDASDELPSEDEVAEPLNSKFRPSGNSANPETRSADAEDTAAEDQAPDIAAETSDTLVSEPEHRTAEAVTGEAFDDDSREPISSESGPQSPGVTVQWIRHGDMNVDQPCDVELVVHNTSRSVVRSVMAEAVIPEGVEVAAANPKPLSGSTSPSWKFGELKPGERRSVALRLIPHERGDFHLDAFVRMTGFSSSTFSVQEPQVEITVEGPEQMEAGQQGNFTVRVTNPGTGMATNVTIQAAIPEGLEHRRGSLLTIEIGTLNPGESRQAQLNVTAVRGGAHQMAVRALADGGLTAQTAASVEIAEPELALQISGPSELMSGRTETFEIDIINEGNVPSANVRARYRVPETFEFVNANRGGKYSDADRSIEWFVGTLQGGEKSHFEVTLKAIEIGDVQHQAGVISEHGKVTMSEFDTTVEGVAELALDIRASKNQLRVGQDISWEIEISNSGSRSATGVGFSCELPSGLELGETSGPTDFIAENGVVVFKSLPEIEPGKSAVYTISAKCTREGTHRLRMRAASESISEPLIGEETTIATGR
ncbi:MAG: hypothetical protein ACK526_05600 [Planctomyces sp.]